MVRDVTALEAPIEHRAEFAIARDRMQQRIAHRARTTRTLARAEIELRQHALEQARDLARDRVRIPQQRLAVRSSQLRELVSDAVVIRPPVLVDARRDLPLV